MQMNGQGPFDSLTGNKAFKDLVNKFINLIDTLGSSGNPLAQVYTTLLGAAAVPVVTAFFTTIGSAAAKVTTLFVTTIGSQAAKATTIFAVNAEIDELKMDAAGADASTGVATLVGGTVTVNSEAIAAMRSASVMPPVFERSGCSMVIDAVLDHAVELEARVVVLAGGERHAAEARRAVA